MSNFFLIFLNLTFCKRNNAKIILLIIFLCFSYYYYFFLYQSNFTKEKRIYEHILYIIIYVYIYLYIFLYEFFPAILRNYFDDDDKQNYFWIYI